MLPTALGCQIEIVCMKLIEILISILFALLLNAQFCFGDGDLDESHTDFFESRIRPLLLNHCIECHGAKNAENGLRLDSRKAIVEIRNGRQGAIVGRPHDSQIVQAVGYDSELKMPPDARLNQQQIDDLTLWVKMGLPWPDEIQPLAAIDIADRIAQHRKSHWAFQPVRRPKFEGFRSDETGVVPIDRIVSKKLGSAGLQLSSVADRRTLIRRATFDLIGLPPTVEQVKKFVSDEDPSAYAKLVDRLLESPHYGERWARHWLDVARYADTRGYTFDNADRNYPFAYTYRDYVINALNNDLPYDQFVREQLAADYLDVPGDKSTLAALGFLSVGRKYISRSDTVDDQVDVVTRGLLGLTVSCARCHDHKYDAIPTSDYYSLYGVFDNCHEPEELPLIGAKPDQEAREFLKKLELARASVKDFGIDFRRQLRDHMGQYLTDYLVRAIAPDQEELARALPEVKLAKSELNQHAITDWQLYLAARAGNDDPATVPLRDMFVLPTKDFGKHSLKLVEYWKANRDSYAGNSMVVDALIANPPRTKVDLGLVYAELLNELREKWKGNGSKEPALEQFEGAEKELASVFFEDDSAGQIPRPINEYLNIEENKKWGRLKSKVAEIHAQSPPSIKRAMTIREDHPPKNPRVMVRGNEGNLGEEVPRRFLEILSSNQRAPFTQRAGRLELANAIVDRDNPLTARVLVNRIWMHHFSKPLVDSPSDFGVRCRKPVQNELLDYLACELMDNGWSIKHLHRIIMMSHTYRQRSSDNPNARLIDPENHLIWKMNRRRLEIEPLRDSMLAVAGNLDRSIFGPAVNLFAEPWSMRRTIYGKIDRQDLPNLLRIFDIANPDQSAAQRTRTTVPQQSLFMMNNKFSLHQSRLLAAKVPLEDDLPEAIQKRVRDLYDVVFQRAPTDFELNTANRFLTDASLAEESISSVWQRYAHALLCTNEFEFID